VPARAPATARDPALARTIHHLRTSAMYAVLDVLGDPWVLRLLHEVGAGRGRFETLVAQLALPRSTLAARLRRLIDDQCLIAEPYSDSPPRFDYRLTARGEDALGAVALLRQWSQRFAPVRAAAETEVHGCGAPLVLDVACRGCGVTVVARDVVALDFPPGAPVTVDVPAPAYRRTRQSGARLPDDALQSPTAEELLGDRWVSLVLGAMLFGLRRFRDFEAALGIAPNILSARLVQLAGADLVTRAGGARAEYRLTERGLALFPAILALVAWGERWLDPDGARRAGWSLLHRPCAAWLAPAILCRACRQPAVAVAR
jgi:DNA-binding HxlR family transcriptional regulator